MVESKSVKISCEGLEKLNRLKGVLGINKTQILNHSINNFLDPIDLSIRKNQLKHEIKAINTELEGLGVKKSIIEDKLKVLDDLIKDSKQDIKDIKDNWRIVKVGLKKKWKTGEKYGVCKKLKMWSVLLNVAYSSLLREMG